MTRVTEIYFFGNGEVSLIGEEGALQPLTYPRKNIYIDYLMTLKENGIIDNETVVITPNNIQRVKFWLDAPEKGENDANNPNAD